MTLGQLRTFLAVAEFGGIRDAAERLHVTQPAVSAVVAALQRELGVVLVQREGRSVRLTPAGHTLATYARRLGALLEEARDAARAAARPETGRLRVAAVNTAGEHLLPPLLASFRRLYPGVAVELEVGNRLTVEGLVGNHEADVAVAGRPGTPGLRSVLVRANQLVVVAAPAVAAAVSTAGDLGARPWLLREPGSGTRATTVEYLAAREVEPVQLTLGSNGAIIAALLLEMGVTLISREAVAAELDAGRLVLVPQAGVPLERTWHVIVRDDPLRPATTDVFLEHLERAGGFAPTPGRAQPDSTTTVQGRTRHEVTSPLRT